MKRRVATGLALSAVVLLGACHHSSPPLGVRLQKTAGDHYEVIYNPATGVYAAEPK